MSLDDLPGPRNGSKRNWNMPTKSKWYPLYQEDEDFKLWFDNLARGSPSTAIEYAKILNRYINLKNTTLNQLTDTIKSNQDQFEKQVMGFVGELEQKEYAPEYIKNYVKILTSWAKWNGVTLNRKIKISNRNHTPTLVDEKVPTIEQVADIRSNASARGRIAVGATAYSGLRPEVLGHGRYEDGLKLGDLPELDIETLEFTIIPPQVVVRRELSKAGHTYRTFLPPSTCRDIQAYLKRRRDQGEILTLDSPLAAVASSHRQKGQHKVQGRTSGHIVSAVVSRDIRKAMRPTYNWRPYVLRSYFSTRLLLAVSNGVIPNNYRVYWMGHTGDMSAHYSSNKAVLPDDLIENMRAAYKRCMSYLVGGGGDEDALRRKMLLDNARMFGIDDDRIAQIEQILSQSDSLESAITEITRSGIVLTHIGTGAEEELNDLNVDQGEYVIVNSDSVLLDYIKDGWSIVKELTEKSNNPNLIENENADVSGVSFQLETDGSIRIKGETKHIDGIIQNLELYGITFKNPANGQRFLLSKN